MPSIALGLTVTAAAEILGVRRATLSEVTNGKASVTAEMALRLEKGLRRQYGSAPEDAGRLRWRSSSPTWRPH
ncbi:MAG: helix-turn-helix domain-containing protein [Deltaproteobacteria bacterium]|nr:helix-turn-helix domain-containing protein [Deltaproteobacteria bacterium]